MVTATWHYPKIRVHSFEHCTLGPWLCCAYSTWLQQYTCFICNNGLAASDSAAGNSGICWSYISSDMMLLLVSCMLWQTSLIHCSFKGEIHRNILRTSSRSQGRGEEFGDDTTTAFAPLTPACSAPHKTFIKNAWDLFNYLLVFSELPSQFLCLLLFSRK